MGGSNLSHVSDRIKCYNLHMHEPRRRGPPRARLPAGRVAFLFTDVEASTQLLRNRPDRYAETLARHRRLITKACSAGVRFGSAGDALFYSFATAPEAISAAAEAQRSLASEPLKVRMGVSIGDVQVVGGDYVGLELHRVARICSAANGGQVLLSAEAVTLAGELPPGLSTANLGPHRLKDFPDPQELHRLAIAGLPDVSTPPRAEDARTVALPRELSTMVGRERELVAIRRLLEKHRLLTLTGAGGSGKTRLARRVGWNVSPLIRGSVVFVAMAPFGGADSVAAEVGRLLGEPTPATWPVIARYFGQGEGLLILDNAEHLPEISEVVEHLLERCGRLTVLVTSRAPLGTPGEHVYTVEPLDIDDAVTLLGDRARERGANLPAGNGTTATLVRIAERLDALPLAIELAAARLRSLSPSGVADRLDRQLDLLTDTRRRSDPRQQTIRNAVGWSYDLLDPRDRAVFEALSVFAGPARLETVAPLVDADEFDTLDSLTRLIDASLVRLTSGDGEDARYNMHEPIRQYAAEMLARHGRAAATERRMVAWYAEFVDRFQSETAYDVTGVGALGSDMPNVWRALAYATRHALPDAGVRIAFHTAHLSWSLAGDAPTRHFLRSSAGSLPASVTGQTMRAILESEHEPYPGSPDLAARARDLARQSDWPPYLWLALRDLFWTACRHGDLETARAAIEEGERAGSAPDRWWVLLRATLAALTGDAGVRDLDRFEAHLLRALHGATLDGAELCDLAGLALQIGEWARARTYATDAAARAREDRLPVLEQSGHLLACCAELMLGDSPGARTNAAELLELRHRAGDQLDCPRQITAHTVAGVLALLGAADEAALLAGAVSPHIRDWCRMPDVHRLGPAQRYLDSARTAIGEWRWSALTAEGAALDLDDALEKARAALSPAR